jgi:allophanate hydrolase
VARDLSFASLRALYDADEAAIDAVLDRLIHRLGQDRSTSVWIHRPPPERLREQASIQLHRKRRGDRLPLYGLPFAVKDNIDVAGMPTTAACPRFAYLPQKSAAIVQRLCDLGAICLGKTNMDQFATGLTGTRSPYGICPSAYDSNYIAGGSSSGSAVAVAKGLASFALGTDSGGSGRIPAGFNNVVGLKPTIGAVSLSGIVPNSRSFDCPSIFALNVDDAAELFDLISGYDADDPFSRQAPVAADTFPAPAEGLSFGAPRPEDYVWFGDAASEQSFAGALARLQSRGYRPQPVPYAVFAEAGRMMLDGPWVAERKAGVRAFFDGNPDALLDVVRTVFDRGDQWSAVDVFEWSYRLMELRRRAARIFETIHFLVVPTAPKPFTVAEILADPIRRNIDVGTYSYFVNLLDLCALTVPNGFLPSGMPTSVTLVAPAWHDRGLAAVAADFARP